MPNIEYNFSGETIVITGAARGQGLSHALTLASAGATVIGLDSSRIDSTNLQYGLATEENLQNSHSVLNSKNSKSSIHDVDITKPEEIDSFSNNVLMAIGPINHLICNAGINYVGDLVDLSDDIILDIVSTNLTANLLLTKRMVSKFATSKGGTITFISSLVTRRSSGQQSVYAASKGGLESLTRALAVELGHKNIRVNALAPTIVNSEQSVGLSGDSLDLSLIDNFYPLRDFNGLQVKDVTNVLLFLMSSEAYPINGSVILLDGGKAAF